MSKSSWVVSLCLAGSLAAAPTLAAPPSDPPPPPAATAPQLLRDIPQLRQTVTLDATDRPLGDVLAALSPTLPADLRAEPDVADQRVTLHLAGQPAYFLMDRLVRLLSHAHDSPHGYHWERLDRGAGARPAFRLWRDSGSVSEEAYERDYPQREIGVILRKFRDLAGMTPQELDSYTGYDPYYQADPFLKAFRGLSDDQLDALAAGQALPLDPALFPDEIAAQHQRQVDSLLERQKEFLAAGRPDPLPNGPSGVPPEPPTLTVTRTDDGTDLAASGDFEAMPGTYEFDLPGVSNRGMLINTYDPDITRLSARLPPDTHGPVVDLTPLLTAPGVTRAQRADVGFTLQALARAAHVTVYQEDFLRNNPKDLFVPHDSPAVGLRTLRAPLPVLIAAICTHWDYQYHKVGDDYLFWSRAWAQDRADDVPERLLAPWRQRLAKQGGLTFDDRAEIAAALTWPQANLTLNAALPTSDPWIGTQYQYAWLRFAGQLAPGQEQAAYSGGGLPLASLTPGQQGALAADLGRQLKSVSADQLAGAALTLEVEDNPAASNQIYVMRLQAGGTQLLNGSVAIPVFPPTPPNSPTALKSGG